MRTALCSHRGLQGGKQFSSSTIPFLITSVLLRSAPRHSWGYLDLGTNVFLCTGQFPPLSCLLGSCAVLQKHWTRCPSAWPKLSVGRGCVPAPVQKCRTHCSHRRTGISSANSTLTNKSLLCVLTILHSISYLVFFQFLTTSNNFITIQAYSNRKFRHLLGYLITTFTKAGPPLREINYS